MAHIQLEMEKKSEIENELDTNLQFFFYVRIMECLVSVNFFLSRFFFLIILIQ